MSHLFLILFNFCGRCRRGGGPAEPPPKAAEPLSESRRTADGRPQKLLKKFPGCAILMKSNIKGCGKNSSEKRMLVILVQFFWRSEIFTESEVCWTYGPLDESIRSKF